MVGLVSQPVFGSIAMFLAERLRRRYPLRADSIILIGAIALGISIVFAGIPGIVAGFLFLAAGFQARPQTVTRRSFWFARQEDFESTRRLGRFRAKAARYQATMMAVYVIMGALVTAIEGSGFVFGALLCLIGTTNTIALSRTTYFRQARQAAHIAYIGGVALAFEAYFLGAIDSWIALLAAGMYFGSLALYELLLLPYLGRLGIRKLWDRGA